VQLREEVYPFIASKDKELFEDVGGHVLFPEDTPGPKYLNKMSSWMLARL
jgi:hypothetical protein